VKKAPKPSPPQSLESYDGLLLVDKPSGPTSHDIVDRIRRHFRIRKVGHGGTLDPMATGLLVILVGRGTKLSNLIMGSDKTYEGTMRLGAKTNTDDADGEVLEEGDVTGITADQVAQEMKKRVGDQMQTPPMVSAVKVKGVPLYKLARKGQTVEREPRFIHVYEFSLTDFDPPDARFVLRCTKGTYVRTLCADIGEALGCGAHLKQLRRTQSGSLTVDDALTLERIEQLSIEDLAEVVIPIHQVLAKEEGQ